MCLRVCVHVCTCMSISVCVYAEVNFKSVPIPEYICKNILLCLYLCVMCDCVNMYASASTCVYVCVPTYTHMHMFFATPHFQILRR